MNSALPAPRRVLPAREAPDAGWPLHRAAASRAIEAAAAATLPPHALMQRAGLAVARLALALAPQARRIWIAAGRGNNGGDGLEAALHLTAAGKEVTLGLQPADRRPADAQAALARAQAAGVAIGSDPAAPALEAGDLAIDAVFGLGLSSAPEGWALAAIQALNGAAAPVLAVDLPSGLDGDSGRLGDEAAVQAHWTLALLTLKPGLFTAAGRDQVGEVWFDGLGVADDGLPPAARLLAGARGLWPQRRHVQHKGSFGDVWVVGGAPGMAGASLLAARAALVAGAGRVLWVPVDASATAAGLDAARPELMLRTTDALQAAGSALAAATVVCGCGGGVALRPLLPLLLSRAGRLLLDADALNALAGDAALAPLLTARAGRGLATLLTPHPLEAARLLGGSTPAVQADRLAAAQELAGRCRALVVLKGSGSVIAAPGEVPWINASGNAALASAGTGDVLAGWIGGLWSQGLTPGAAARLGTWSHGAAADRWQAGKPVAAALEASELIGALRAFRQS